MESQRLKKIQQEEERRRIVLEKAQRDRVKTQESLKRQAADKERNRIFKMRFEDHLARSVTSALIFMLCGNSISSMIHVYTLFENHYVEILLSSNVGEKLNRKDMIVI